MSLMSLMSLIVYDNKVINIKAVQTTSIEEGSSYSIGVDTVVSIVKREGECGMFE